MPKALFCDFDGVFHPPTAIVGLDLALLAIAPGQVIRQRGLFRWCARLESALQDAEDAAGTPVAEADRVLVVVHSNWARQPWITNAVLRDALGPLAHRYAGATDPSLPRQQAIDDFCARVGIDDRLILDDASAEFAPVTRGLVITNPLLGVSDPEVLYKIVTWASGAGPREQRTPGVLSDIA